ncbi:SDR family oxidoreductase [Leisingera sp. D0M16]|uniref:SDR family oxidoreductase n=1 Tax=Leisingera coralii TaxID=3351347 RepID=UPI003B823870
MTQAPILIAGATGMNGRALIDALRKTGGAAVRALVRDPAKARLGDDVEVVQGDLADPASLARAFDGIDKAYIVTAIQPGTLSLFRNFFDAAKAADVKHVVKFSGLGSSVDSPSKVIRQHGASDDLLRGSGLRYTILRPNSFHQNMLGQAASIAGTGQFYLPLGNARQSTIDVRDIAEITAKILMEDGHEGHAYDLTGPESLNFHDVAEILGEVRGAPVSYVPISRTAMKDALKQAGFASWPASVLAEIMDLFSTGAYAGVLPDAERLLGRPPRSFRAFAQDHANHWSPDGSAANS